MHDKKAHNFDFAVGVCRIHKKQKYQEIGAAKPLGIVRENTKIQSRTLEI